MKVSQADIDFFLCKGSGFRNGESRIVKFFTENTDPVKRAAFLKNEYGHGGGTVVFPDGVWGHEEHSPKGCKVSRGGFSNNEGAATLTWGQVQARVDYLIKAGQYFPSADKQYTIPQPQPTPQRVEVQPVKVFKPVQLSFFD